MPAAALKRFALGLKSALAFAYPLVAHFAVVRNSMALLVAALALLIVLPLLPALIRGSVVAWIAALPIAAGLWWISRSTHATLPLYIAPILVPGFMAGVFGSSLMKGQTPVIEQMIRIMEPGDHGGVPEQTVWAYARALTRGWTILFVAIAATNLILGLLAEPEGLLRVAGITPPVAVPETVWSLFANVIGYLLVAAFFVIEYAYRRQRFPRQPYRNLLDFFWRVLAAMPRLVSNAAGAHRMSDMR
ncbi:MAG: hypothetical protein ABW171_03280 [Steroidobacter sp.]